ncbi:MAG: glutamate ABC transporter substrate-binding protein [Thermoleophilaceae bacterium]|nr:glutamate ABC transporter substrate-binding protein [Thermoleophilaceae bacterium]
MRSTDRLRQMAVALIALAALVAAGCGGTATETTDTAASGGEAPAASLDRIEENGEIVIGVKYDVPPFGFRNPDTGDVEGFDVELGRAIAEDLGVEPRFVEAISDNRIPFLQDGTVDLILSTMTITGERDQEIDFSEPYYIANGRILATKGSDIAGLDDLAGRPVCTVLGSTYADTVEERAPDADLQLVDTYSECLELIQNGSVEAVVTDDVILTGMIIQDDSLELVGDDLTTEPYGAGLRDGDTEFQKRVNEAIDEYKEDGRWEASYEEWVGQYTGIEQQPPTMTLKEAIKLAP